MPLLYQPGESWLYDTCSAIQGMLVERASGTSLPDFLTERVFAPLGMRDCGFLGFPLGGGGLTGTVAVLLTQAGADSPEAPAWMRDFWALTS